MPVTLAARCERLMRSFLLIRLSFHLRLPAISCLRPDADPVVEVCVDAYAFDGDFGEVWSVFGFEFWRSYEELFWSCAKAVCELFGQSTFCCELFEVAWLSWLL